MGMTDRQFDSYQQSLLRQLQTAIKDFEQTNEIAELRQIVKDIEAQLQRP